MNSKCLSLNLFLIIKFEYQEFSRYEDDDDFRFGKIITADVEKIRPKV